MIFEIIVSFIHLISAFLWIGSLLFYNIAVTPFILNNNLQPSNSLAISKKFDRIAQLSVIGLFITGILKIFEGINENPQSGDSFFNFYTVILIAKLMVVFTLIIFGMAKDKPIEGYLNENYLHKDRINFRNRIKWITRVEIILSLLLLCLLSILIHID